MKFSEYMSDLKNKMPALLNKDIKIKRNFSIKYKILIGIAGVVLLNIFINIIFVNLFMNNYYISLKQGNLKNTYSDIYRVYNTDAVQVSNEIYKAEECGISVRILDSNNNYIYRTSNYSNTTIPVNIQSVDRALLQQLGQNNFINLTLKDTTSHNYMINFIGRMDNSKLILSSSIRVIQENTSIAQTFIVISSFITFIIVAIIIYIFSNRVTRKIDDIREITENISNLKFGKKINITSHDELGQLLNNINTMSDKLESAIGKLESANRDLKDENEELEKIEKMRKQLITNISHEFKTPLTLISGYNQILKSKFKDKKDSEYIDVIISETEKLNQLVLEFLELSKIENNTLKLVYEKINLPDVINEYLDSMKLELVLKSIQVNTNFENIPVINSDLNSVKKIVSNIIGNAIKYVSNEKIVNINISEQKTCITLSVFNTCEPIEDNILKNIWNSLYKTTNTRNKEGAGLGLTIVKSLCDMIKAKYSVQNVENGVEFKISFLKK